MKTFVNIRGTNGSGKSTLARRFFGEHDAEVNLCGFVTKSGKSKWATGIIGPADNVCVVGNYDTMAGGLDKLPNFRVQQEAVEAALRLPEVDVVVAEGILASTVLGSWDEQAKRLHETGTKVIWAFMSTPLNVCIQRVKDRPKKSSKKTFNEQLVVDKWKTIDGLRQRSELRSHIHTVSLPYLAEYEALRKVLGLEEDASGSYLS